MDVCMTVICVVDGKMFRYKLNCQFLVKRLTFSNNVRYASDTKIELLSRILAVSNKEVEEVFRKHKCLIKSDHLDIQNTMEYLTKIGITVDEIRRRPRILCFKKSYLENCYEILKECEFSYVNAYCFHKYYQLMQNSEMSLKLLGHIGSDIDLQQRLADLMNVQLRPCNQDASLSNVRMHISRIFCVDNNIMTNEEFQAMNPSFLFRHRPLQTIKRVTNILIDKFHVPPNEIIKYIHFLNADPNNLEKVLTMEPIGGVEMHEILLQTPNLIYSEYEHIRSILADLKTLEISDDQITKCFRVLAMDPNKFRTSFSEMNLEKAFAALKLHPDVLKLILHQFRAQNRLSRLYEVDKKCFSINILTGKNKEFERFIASDTNMITIRDLMLLLANTLKIKPTEVESVEMELRKHRYYRQVPLPDISNTSEKLIAVGYKVEDIVSNIQIVLYAEDVIMNRLKEFEKSEQIGGKCWKDLSKKTQLKMILYQIELEFNFNGDGVFLGSNRHQTLE